MATTAEIDTTNLLTILGLVAAVWALISPASKLRLRISITWIDWFVISAIVFLIHYLVFAPMLESLGMYYSFGAWKWGLDSSSAVYILILAAVFYFFWRTKSPKLVREKIFIFRELSENLLLTKRYDELVLLVEPQLPKLISFATPINSSTTDLGWFRSINTLLQPLRGWRLADTECNTQARETLTILVTSPELTTHLAKAHPHFCLKLVEADIIIRSDFIDNYIGALLSIPGSRLYIELKNNRNLSRGNRLDIPPRNRLLSFFFSNASNAVKKGLDKAIGETICRMLDEDNKLAETLNKPIGYYRETGKFHCPINSGITLFEIMIHEGIHQGLQDHMWLHYFRHFAFKILDKMKSTANEDNFQEWPTPFHYLLYRLVAVTSEWCEQCNYIIDEEIPEETRSAAGFNRFFISEESAKALGDILEDVIKSEKISDRFKKYLIEAAIRSYIRMKREAPKNMTELFIKYLINGSDLPRCLQHQTDLQRLFVNIDHVLRGEAGEFEAALNKALSPQNN